MTTRLPILVLLLAGCATAPRPAPDAVLAAEQQLARDHAELTTPAAGARPTDCHRARTLRDNICTLAERICALVARDVTIPDGPRRCRAARDKCEGARTRVSAACGS